MDDGFEVVRIHAGSDAAKVVDFKTGRDRADEKSVRYSVSRVLDSVGPEISVTAVQRTSPVPAS